MLTGTKYSNKTANSLTDYVVLPWFNDDNQKADMSLITQLKAQGKTLKGHPVFHKRKTPKSLTLDDLEAYIDNKIGSYGGVLDEWDALVEVIGFLSDEPDWEYRACEIMRDRAPFANLWLNEYAIKDESYWDKVIDLAERLEARGLIDGVGIQCHVDLRGFWRRVPGVENMTRAQAESQQVPLWAKINDYGQATLRSKADHSRLEAQVTRIHELGLEAQISELTVCGFTDEGAAIEATKQSLIDSATQLDMHSVILWGDM